MKKFLMILMAAGMMLFAGMSSASAQGPGGFSFDPDEMAKMRVEQMKQSLKLNKDQETKLTALFKKQSEEMVNYLLQEFEGDTGKIWQSNIFGRSFHEIVNEDLQAKLKRMPDDARKKLQETLERIINEGSGGLICIIL